MWDVAAEAGLYRLRGHRDMVTDVAFVERGGRLLSASKDSHVRVWELATQHCCQTLVGHRCEVWALDVDPAERRCVTGAADAQLRVFALVDDEAGALPAEAGGALLQPMGALSRPGSERCAALRFSPRGGILAVAPAGRLVELWDVHSPEEARRRMRRRKKRKRDKLEAKGEGGEGGKAAAAAGAENGTAAAPADAEAAAAGDASDALVATDEFGLLATLPLKAKALSLAFAPTPRPGALVSFAVTLASNCAEAYDLMPAEGDAAAAARRCAEVATAGHRADVRALALASDDSLLLSTSHAGCKVRCPAHRRTRQHSVSQRTSFLPAHANSVRGSVFGDARAKTAALARLSKTVARVHVRQPALLYRETTFTPCAVVTRTTLTAAALQIWNPKSGACLRSVDCGYGLCASFAPGARHALVGTKAGQLVFVDVGAATVTRTLAAHAGPLWSLALQPDGAGFVTGGGDKEVKFWDFSLAPPERDDDAPADASAGAPEKTLAARHMRTLRLPDDVLCVRFSPDGKLLCVALLDSTMKVFFADTLKFFLSLYGHKLPVLAMDVSSDGALLASGSADKNVKLWGLDFGDCHASIRAHDDSVTALAFVPRTHYLFTASKDRTVRYWDADTREPLLTLPGHAAEVWGLAVSSLGDFFVTAGHDRSLRRWERTEEPFFVEEERERRLESLFEDGLEDGPDRGRPSDAAPGTAAQPDEGAVGLAGRRSMATLGAAESIVDALEMAAAEGVRRAEYDVEADKVRVHVFTMPCCVSCGRARVKRSDWGEGAPRRAAAPAVKNTLIFY